MAMAPRPLQQQSAISIKELNFSYGEFPVLECVNLDIEKLESICIVGPNGGGKTTLIKLMLGLLLPDTGTITIYGRSPIDARLLVSYVPQYAHYDPHFPISVFEVVIMGRLQPKTGSRYSRLDRDRAMEALELVGLSDLSKRSFSQISGGQRQRALIARALASEGKILILDEPTANIDQKSEGHFFELLSELNQNMTILMITHEIALASRFFKRIACVNRQVVIHPTSELTGELIRDMYGGDLRMIRHDHQCSAEGHRHD